MAEIGFDLQELQGQERGCIVAWGALGKGDTGRAAKLIGERRSIQVEGSFGVGGSITVRGSNDGVHFRVLHDPFGNDLVLTSPQLVGIAEPTAWILPEAGGDESTAIEATLLVKI